jgi:hypothetical protein
MAIGLHGMPRIPDRTDGWQAASAASQNAMAPAIGCSPTSNDAHIPAGWQSHSLAFRRRIRAASANADRSVVRCEKGFVVAGVQAFQRPVAWNAML